ncbi:hypothetical protein WG922_11060 [Ramlibacter sp. AN1015]|uniref:hypothetical protein n=1 Tax=Ramlibacter sp. AN1015 TaxID=3133428 RepID=UPI0030C49417
MRVPALWASIALAFLVHLGIGVVLLLDYRQARDADPTQTMGAGPGDIAPEAPLIDSQARQIPPQGAQAAPPQAQRQPVSPSVAPPDNARDGPVAAGAVEPLPPVGIAESASPPRSEVMAAVPSAQASVPAPPAPAPPELEQEAPRTAPRDPSPASTSAPERRAPKATSAQPAKAPQLPVQPSFDCRRARSTPEKLICSDAELARLDRELGRLYARARTASGDPASFRRQQNVEWTRREQTCKTRECLVAWYARRRQQLSDIIAVAPVGGVPKKRPARESD